jgi:hypothetical protein
MSFPVIHNADTQFGAQDSNSTTWTLTYPTNIVSGDLLIALVATDGTAVATATGWGTKYASSSTNASLNVLTRKADGTETGTFSLSLNASEQGNWRIFRITGWEGTEPWIDWEVIGNGDQRDSVSFSLKVATGSDANPNPPALNPANWDVEDTLWIAVEANDHTDSTTAYPTSFLGSRANQVGGGSGGAGLAVAANGGSAIAIQTGLTSTLYIKGDGGGEEALGQTFLNTNACTLAGVAVYAGTQGAPAPTDGLVIEVRSGSFTGTLLATSDPVYPSGVSTWYMTGFSSPPLLDASTTYYLVFRRTGSRDTSHYYSISYGAGVFPNAEQWVKASGSWSQGGLDNDLMFAAYAETASLDPGTFTLSGSEEWVAATIAIRPASTAAPIEPVTTNEEFFVFL